jgi:hypothetical protein
MINEWMCLIDTTPAPAPLTRITAADGQEPDITAAGSYAPGPVCSPGAEAVPNDGNGVPDHRGHDRASGNPPSDIVGRQRVVLLPHDPSRTVQSSLSRIAKQLLDEQADAAKTRQSRRQTPGRQ